mgnify:CR=1 FL=1
MTYSMEQDQQGQSILTRMRFNNGKFKFIECSQMVVGGKVMTNEIRSCHFSGPLPKQISQQTFSEFYDNVKAHLEAIKPN